MPALWCAADGTDGPAGNGRQAVSVNGVRRLLKNQVCCSAVVAALATALFSGTAFAAEFPRVVAVRVSGEERRGDEVVKVTSGGSAVSVGGGRFVTASHLVEGMRNFKIEVDIDGTWTRGRIATVDDRDAAVVTCGDEAGDAHISLGEPRYGQRVTVVGLKSGMAQRGTVSDTRTVSLDVDSSGIQQGDSGGGIFADDGALIGIISARNPNEPRVVYFTHAEAVSPLIARK
jgi:hypothetical protein